MLNQRLRFCATSSIIPLVLGSVACSDRTTPGPDNPEPRGIVISNAQLTSTAGVVGDRASIYEETSVAYVSIKPGTYPDSTTVSIRNLTANSAPKTLKVVDGGLDPVAIEAHAGDVLELTISVPGAAATVLEVKVPPRRPPTVVRTNPAKGRIDVAVNSVSITVVFTEPIDPKTVNPTSVGLLLDGKPVSGTIRSSENGLVADFSPDELLQPRATYELVVTQDIRDLDGDALEASYSSTFTTGESLCPNLRGYVFSSEPLTGCYLDVKRSLGPIWLVLNQLDTRLGVLWNYLGEADPDFYSPDLWAAGEFSPTSSEGTFGTVKLHLYVGGTRCAQRVCSLAENLIEAEITKADGSELSGKWVYWDYESGSPKPDQWKPIVLRRFSK